MGRPVAARATTSRPAPKRWEKALDEIRKSGRGGWRKLRENWNKILRSESERAISMAEEFLRGGWGGEERKVRTIETIGKHSPAVWAPIIEPYVDDKSEEMRKAAVTALGELRNPKSSRVLSKALRNRKETDAVRGRILRAMAKIDPESSKLAREIGKALGPKNEENLRAHATLAAAKLERRKDVTKWLSTALSDPSPLVRKTAIYMIASRRDKEMLPLMHTAMATEKEAECKKLAEAAAKAVEGGKLDAFKDLRKQLDEL
jgi:hypothetical protein